MTTIQCAQCGDIASSRPGSTSPRCEACEIWLVAHDGERVSYAEREHRQISAENQRAVQATHTTATASLPQTQQSLPDSWHAAVDQTLPGTLYQLAVQPPHGSVDATAYLVPPDDERGWHVRVHNRAQGVGFPLYTDGGAHAASFATVQDAVAAAVTALRIEIVGETHRTRR